VLTDIKIIVAVEFPYWRVTMVAAAKFRIIEFDIGNDLEPITEIDGNILG
jgi:hypothetical protein